MKDTNHFVASAVLSLALAACSEASGPARPSWSEAPLSASGAGTAGNVYTMTNATSGNAVLVFDRSADGTLTPAGSVGTNGNGNGGGLGNQNGLIFSENGRFLLAVNAGSNTITSFRVQDHGVTTPKTPARRYGMRFLVGGGLVAAAAAAFLLVSRDAPSVSPPLVASDYRAVADGRRPLEMVSNQPAAIEELFRQRGISFPTRVFDLGMMGYQVTGGSVVGAGSRTRALFVYRGGTGQTLVCQMYVAQTSDLPPADEVRENNGIQFLIHREGNMTLVFWRRGDDLRTCLGRTPGRSHRVSLRQGGQGLADLVPFR